MLYRDGGRVHLLTEDLGGLVNIPADDAYGQYDGEGDYARDDQGRSLHLVESSKCITMDFADDEAGYEFTQWHDSGKVDFTLDVYAITNAAQCGAPTFRYDDLEHALKIKRVRIMFDKVRAIIDQDFPIYDASDIRAYFENRKATASEAASIDALIPRINDKSWIVRRDAVRKLHKFHFVLSPWRARKLTTQQRLSLNAAIGDFRIDGTWQLLWLASLL